MGQKVNPHGARVGVIWDWSTKWYATRVTKFKTNVWIRPFYMGQEVTPHGARIGVIFDWSPRRCVRSAVCTSNTEKPNINTLPRVLQKACSIVQRHIFGRANCRIFAPT
jgi:hypothetical protein